MKKVLIAVVALVFLLALSFVIAAAVAPDSYTVTRDITIDGKPTQIYEYVGHLNTWPEWTSWNAKKYPGLKYEFGEKSEGVGAHQSWTQESGRGEITVTQASPESGITYDLVFDEAMKSVGQVKFETADGGTKVTWTNSGDLPFMIRPLFLFVSLEDMMGEDFEEGLAGLKKKVEG